MGGKVEAVPGNWWGVWVSHTHTHTEGKTDAQKGKGWGKTKLSQAQKPAEIMTNGLSLGGMF